MTATLAIDTKKIHINWKYVLLFGLWDAAWAIMWGVYNNYMPVFWQAGNPNYNVLGASTAVGFGLGAFSTGLIMSIDNIASVVMQPIFGALSDRAKSRKRIVVIAGAIPAIFFALIPFGFMSIPAEKSGQFAALVIPFIIVMTLALCMIVSWGVSKGSEYGLRYSIIPSAVRTQVYSYTAVFGGFAFVATFLGANMLYKINPGLPFWVGSGFLAVTVLGYAIFMKEPKGTTLSNEDFDSVGQKRDTGFKVIWEGLKLFSPDQKRALAIISGTKFLAWSGVAGLETFASSYVVNSLGLDESAAGNLIAIYFLGYLVFAVPAGYLAAKLGRKNMLRVALIAFIVAGITQFTLQNMSMIYFVLLLAGAANSTTDIMVTPMISDIAPSKKVMGITVAIASSVTTLASVLAVPAWGAIIQAFGNNFGLLWLGLAIMPALGFILISTLKPGLGEAKAVTSEEVNW
jgi:maltose/moltooligosaccharide transporter